MSHGYQNLPSHRGIIQANFQGVTTSFLHYTLGCPPPRMPVTTRIMNHFLAGDPNLNLHLPQESWEGRQPKLYLLFLPQSWFSRKWAPPTLVFFSLKVIFHFHTFGFLPEEWH